ncbi:hypothetical protein PTKU15_80170 [Paraburkholderia terrae]|nr:hypothetical protein PTKU15_80170 [Paraburkholderia terrae]
MSDRAPTLFRSPRDSGNHKSNEQQNVVVEPAPAGGQTILKSEPANPQVIYVPAYNPTVF